MNFPSFEIVASGKVRNNIYCCLSLSSTQDKVWELSSQGAVSGTLVISREQLAGRGRRGREWLSPAGGLWFSLLIYPVSPAEAGKLTLHAARCLALAVESASGIKPRVKLPNDLYYRNRKLAGIILELRDGRAVLGVGLNVNNPTGGFPGTVPAVGLREITGRHLSRSAILKSFLSYFEPALPRRFC